MSAPILPFAPWLSGTNQNSIPANDNSLRNQILNGLVISDSTDAQPGSPSDGDIYIMTGAASGAQWGGFDEFDLAIFMGGTWYAYAPVEGVTVNLQGQAIQWDGAAYVAFAGLSDAPSDGNTYGRRDGEWEQIGSESENLNIITEASAFTADPGTHNGLTRYIRAGGDVTFDSAEPYAAGMVFNIRATAAIELVEDGVTLTPPAGGTLDLSAGMAVQVVMTSATTADVIGQTVAA